MPRMIRRRFGMKRESWFLIAIAMTGVGVGAALAQVTPSTGGTDIATLLQQFGSLFGSGTGTTGTTGTTTPTTPTTTTQPGEGGRAPTVISNQFNTTQGASLQERSPGVWIQNAIAEHEGTSEFLTGDATEEPPNFFKATFDQIALGLINELTTLLSGFNLMAGVNPTPNPGDGTNGSTTGGLTTIPNATTTGAGTSMPIQ